MSRICDKHKKEYVEYCVSNQCKLSHAGICSHPDCLSFH